MPLISNCAHLLSARYPACAAQDGQESASSSPHLTHSALLGFQNILLLTTQTDKQGQEDHPYFSDRKTDTLRPRQNLKLGFH